MKKLWCTLLLCAVSCSSDDKAPKEAVGSDKEDSEKLNMDEDGGSDPGSIVTLVQSLSNNALTGYRVDANKAEGFAKSFRNSKSKEDLQAAMSGDRLARKSVAQVMGHAKKIMALEMSKNPGASPSELMKLEIALTALQNRQMALADYYLDELTKAKNPKIRAAAFNNLGVIALKDDRIPEAAKYFKEALSQQQNYKPAHLNLGFVALRGGDLGTARRHLGDFQNDHFVKYGMISISRIDGNSSRAESLCGEVLEKQPEHRAALFNCALFHLQNKKDFTKARSLTDKAVKSRGGDVSWDERIMQLLNDIDLKEAEHKRELSAKKEANKPKEPPKDSGSKAPQAAPTKQPPSKAPSKPQ